MTDMVLRKIQGTKYGNGGAFPDCPRCDGTKVTLVSHGNFSIIWHFPHQPRKTSTRPPDVHTIIAHQVYAGESYPVGLWVPTWVAGRMTSALLLG